MPSFGSPRSGLMSMLLASAAMMSTATVMPPDGGLVSRPTRKRRKHRKGSMSDYEVGYNRAPISYESEQAVKEARVQAEQQRQAKKEAKRARREAQRNQHRKT